MKTVHWAFATGVAVLPTATAWTVPTLINGPYRSSSLRTSGERLDDDGREFLPPPRREREYSRVIDPHTNGHDVDSDSVNALVDERALARKNKDFRRADDVLNRLLTRHGVVVNDTDGTWKTLTKKEMKKRKKVVLPRAAVDPVGRGGGRDRFELSPSSGPNSSTLSEREIVALINDRRTAQRGGDYKEADSIRHRLKVSGVYVEDGLKEWRWDGVPFDTVRGKLRGYASNSPRASLVRSEYSLALDDDGDTVTVNDLLAQRSKAKSSGNYEKSDRIRDRLFETYNIRIDDRLGEWSIGGNFGNENNSHWASNNSLETSLGYTKSAASVDLPSAADEKYVQAKVDERMRAKRTRNYDLSDSIRDELYYTYDVTIHDKINEWSVGGVFGGDNSWNNVVSVKKELAEGGGGYKPGSKSFGADRDSQRQLDAPASLSKEQLECFTVVQLKEKLRDSGQPVSGTKAKLINRLLLGKTNV